MREITAFVCAMLAAAAILAGCMATPPAAAPTAAPATTSTLAVTPMPTAAPTLMPTPLPEATVISGDAAVTAADGAIESRSLLAQMGATDFKSIDAWPMGLPKQVPAFKYGQIMPEASFEMGINGTTAYSIYYTGAKQEDIDAYIQALKKNRFTVDQSQAGNLTSYNCIYMEKDGSKTLVMLLHDASNSLITVMPHAKKLH